MFHASKYESFTNLKVGILFTQITQLLNQGSIFNILYFNLEVILKIKL